MVTQKPKDIAPSPFARPIAVESLSAGRPTPFDLIADETTKSAVAVFLGLPEIETLRFKGEIAAAGRERWRLAGRLTARLSQACVVTLVPVAESIDEDIVRDFVPTTELSESETIEIDTERDDDPDPYEQDIDPGAVAVECLSLALAPYPRAPGAEIVVSSVTAPGIEPLKDEDLKPFAGLAELKEKMARDE